MELAVESQDPETRELPKRSLWKFHMKKYWERRSSIFLDEFLVGGLFFDYVINYHSDENNYCHDSGFSHLYFAIGVSHFMLYLFAVFREEVWSDDDGVITATPEAWIKWLLDLFSHLGWKLLSFSQGQELGQQASWLQIGCTKGNNQSEARSVS